MYISKFCIPTSIIPPKSHTQRMRRKRSRKENGGEKGGDFNNLKEDPADADASIGLHLFLSPRRKERSGGYSGGTCL